MLSLGEMIRQVLVQARLRPILSIYFSNLYYNCTLVEPKASNIIQDSGTVTDSPPSPFTSLTSV